MSATVQLYVHVSPPVKLGYVLAVTGSVDVHSGASSTALTVTVTVATLLSQYPSVAL